MTRSAGDVGALTSSAPQVRCLAPLERAGPRVPPRRPDPPRAVRRLAPRRRGYVEPRTSVTETTIVLVAADGEWTRRRIDGPDTARRLSRELGIPVYDAQVTGYPQRMRDWNKDHPAPHRSQARGGPLQDGR